MKSRIKFSVILTVLVLLSMLAAGELLCRISGISPWRPETKDITITPDESLYEPDAQNGYKLRLGGFHLTSEEGLNVRLTNTPLGRITSEVTHPLKMAQEIWVFGCSFTYGTSLSDDETFLWVTQKLLPDSNIRNFGVPGYSNVQSYFQFQNLIRKYGAAPAKTILVYASFHDERNASLKSRRRSVITYKENEDMLKEPYVRIENGSVVFKKREETYTPFPLSRHLALMKLLDDALIRKESAEVPAYQISKAVIVLFSRLAEKMGSEFILAGIERDYKTLKMLEFAESQGIQTVDLSVNLGAAGMRNLPLDEHPSAKANQVYALKLTRKLKELAV